jgi:glutamate racemase
VTERAEARTGPTIGVFDSGFGGLTVLRALLPLIPGARYLYLGDTARLPYGSKSRETIARYAVSSAKFLEEQGAEHLVVACNTATALALDEIREALKIGVTGVIEPGAQAAACNGSVGGEGGHVLVLATAATVQSGTYTRALEAQGLAVTERACPLLVPLVEEGWLDFSDETAAVTAEVLRIYLAAAQVEAPGARSLLLGCTHYPLLKLQIEATLAKLAYPLAIVDAAQATAEAVAAQFPAHAEAATRRASMHFYATDSIEKFQRLGSRFLGQELERVELIDLGG